MRILNAGLLTVLAGMMAACGNPFAKVRNASDRMNYMNDMKQMAMHNYQDKNSRMPKNANDLIAASPELQGSTAGSRLMSGEITMVWGFNLNDQSQQGTSLTLMGWSMSSVFNGNVGAIFCDGSVQMLTMTEFETALRPVFKAPPVAPTGPVPPTRPVKGKLR
jgi:hypothetical protein